MGSLSSEIYHEDILISFFLFQYHCNDQNKSNHGICHNLGMDYKNKLLIIKVSVSVIICVLHWIKTNLTSLKMTSDTFHYHHN